MEGKIWIIHGEGSREKLVPTLETSGQHLFLTHIVQLKFVKLTLNNLLCDWFINLLLPRIISMETESQWGISDIVCPWTCLWMITLIKLIDVGVPSPLSAAPYLRQGFLNYVRAEKLIQTLGSKQTRQHGVYLFLYALEYVWCVLSSLSWWFINWNCKMNKFPSLYVAIPQDV